MALFDRARRAYTAFTSIESARDIIDSANKIPTASAGGGNGWGGTQMLFNALTGFGTPRDAAWMNRWLPQRMLRREELFALGRNALSFRALNLIGSTATAEGWTVKITDDAVTDKLGLSEQIAEYENRLALPAKCARAIARGRQYGDAIVLLGIEDGAGDWSKPVDVHTIKTIRWAVVLDRRDFNYWKLAPQTSADFGNVELYQITDINGVLEDGLRYGGDSISYATDELTALLKSGNGQFNVHASRVLSFRTHDGFSQLDSIQDSLAAYLEAAGGVRTAAREASLVKYKIGPWLKKMWSENAPLAYQHMSNVDRAKTANNAYVLDKDEDVETLSRNLSGVEGLVNPFMAWLAAALDIPVTVFWGVSPGGFGKGESERATWHEAVYAFQTTTLEPQLTKAHGYILAAWDGPHLHAKIKRKIIFADLSPLDEMQAATLRSQAIDDLAKLKREDILSRDEIRASLPTDAYFSPQLIEIDDSDDKGLGPMQVGAITGSVAILQAVYPNGVPIQSARTLQGQVDPQRFTPEVVAQMFPDLPAPAAATASAGATPSSPTPPNGVAPASMPSGVTDPANPDASPDDTEDGEGEDTDALTYSADPIPTDAMEAADLAEIFGLPRRSAGRITKAAREGKFRAFKMFGGRPRFSRSEVEAAWRKDNGLDGVADGVAVADARDAVTPTTLFVSLRIPDDIAATFPYKPNETSPPHVTLAICECPEGKRDAVMQSLLDAFALLDPFDVTLGPLDYFEQPDRARRVAYVHAMLSTDAMTFHAEIVEALEREGCEVRAHAAYAPHATLAYLDDLESFTGQVPAGTWHVDEIEVQYAGERVYVALDGARADEPDVSAVRDDALVDAVRDAFENEWIWRTQRDRRVRSRHRKLEGRKFKEGDRHPTEGIPGELPNCRCAREIVVPRDASLKVKRAAKRNVRRALARKYKQITVPAIKNERTHDSAARVRDFGVWAANADELDIDACDDSDNEAAKEAHGRATDSEVIDEDTVKRWLVEHISGLRKMPRDRMVKLKSCEDVYPYLAPPKVATIYRGLYNVKRSAAGRLVGPSDAVFDKSWTTDIEVAARFASAEFTDIKPDADTVGMVLVADAPPDKLLLNHELLADLPGVADYYHERWKETLRASILNEREVVALDALNVRTAKIVPMSSMPDGATNIVRDEADRETVDLLVECMSDADEYGGSFVDIYDEHEYEACDDEYCWVTGNIHDQSPEERIDEAFAAYHDAVNMGASELEEWAATEWSKKTSLSREPIERNLRLLRKKKEDWTLADAKAAMRTVSFVSRMKGAEQGKPVKIDGREGPSKRDISLLNWAFDPRK